MNMSSRKTICGLLVLLVYALLPGMSRAQDSQDNASVAAQLDAAKPILAKIKKDAEDMESYTRNNGLSWQTHATTLEKIKADVNQLQENMRGLQSHRTVASPWQQDAIDRITALANDLATNMNAAIAQLSKSKSRPTAPPYPEYLKANARIANDLIDAINDTIDYGQTKVKMDSLAKQLS
jgi:hypothetical protein